MDEFDVVVVGAGPAGVAAAVTAAEAGRSVAVVDDSTAAGGQIWRHRGDPPAAARRWLDRLQASGVTPLQQARVVAKPAPFTLLAETPDGPRRLRWGALVLAVGARELFLPFPGWTLPGVVGAGGMQALVKQGLDVAGKRVVVAGSGPLLLAVADLLRAHGAEVPVILEQALGRRVNGFAVSLVRTPGKLVAGVALRARLVGTRYATDAYVTRVTAGDARPSGPPLNKRGSLRVECRVGGRVESVDCDYLACGFGLVPNNELPTLLGCAATGAGFVRVDGRCETSVPGVYAVGEVTGVGGVDKSVLEGRIAGRAVVGEATNDLTAAHRSALAFARRLDAAFSLRPELAGLAEPGTIVCRCEDVPLSAVRLAMSGRDAKLQSRCGMGACQGRVCGPIVQRVLGCEPPAVRPPVFATTVGTLAAGGGG